MKRIKTALFATTILGTLGLIQHVQADSTDATVSISNYSEYTGIFDINARQQTNGKPIRSIDVAVWSEKDGQDDLKWYSANSTGGEASVRFDVKNHNYKAGKYITHAYVNYMDGSKKGFALENKRVSISKPNITLNSQGVRITSLIQPDEGALISAVWSDENGQDDIKWYKSDSLGNATATYTNHKGYGKYHVHTYLNKDGKMTGIGVQSIDISKPTVTKQIVKVNDTSYDVTIGNVPSYLTSIRVPVWTENNGQDDIKWYQADKVAEGTYKARIYLKNHHFETGRYSVHIYGDSQLSKKLDGLAMTNFDVSSISTFGKPQAGVSNYNVGKGSFNVDISETLESKSIKSIRVAVWSEANQSNIYWYQSSSVSNGKISISANVKNHANKTGLYNVHAYVKFTDGTEQGFILPSQQLNQIVEQTNVAGKPKITTYINEKNTYPVGQCTWGVKELAPWAPNWLGNGGQWAANARAKGFRTGSQPKVGAIASWDDGGYGHVAYVTHVDNAKRIQVKEANYLNNQYISNFRGWFDPTASYWGRLTYIYPD